MIAKLKRSWVFFLLLFLGVGLVIYGEVTKNVEMSCVGLVTAVLGAWVVNFLWHEL